MGLAGSLLPLDALLDNGQWRTAAGRGEVRRGPEVLAPQVLAGVAGELLPRPAGGGALEGAGEAGQGGLGRVADEGVHVAGFAVELAEPRAGVCADLPRDLLAAGQDLPGERAAPVLRCEDQVSTEVAGDAPSPVHVGVLIPAWCHRPALCWVP
jgi:hypothetical protein